MMGLTGFFGLVRSADGSLFHHALLAIAVRRHALLTIARAVLPCESVHYWHFRCKSPVCLPSTVYKAGSTTVRGPHPGIHSQAGLSSSTAAALPVAAFAALCPHFDTASGVLGEGLPEQSDR